VLKNQGRTKQTHQKEWNGISETGGEGAFRPEGSRVRVEQDKHGKGVLVGGGLIAEKTPRRARRKRPDKDSPRRNGLGLNREIRYHGKTL